MSVRGVIEKRSTDRLGAGKRVLLRDRELRNPRRYRGCTAASNGVLVLCKPAGDTLLMLSHL